MNFFSIIIPTYNRAAYLVNTVRSALNQSQDNFEVIVVDDGSTDDTEEIIKNIQDPKLRYYKKENGERGAARNFGTRMAKGNYVTFLDSDDELFSNFIEAADKLAQQFNPEFFHLGYEIKNTQTGKSTIYKLRPTINQDLITGNYLSCLGVFVEKETALKNPFSENRKLSTLEDWELWLRLAAQFRLYYNNAIFARLNDHGERSVANFEVKKMIERHELFIQMVTTNTLLVQKYSSHFKEFISSNYSYISLHIALSGTNKSKAVTCLWKSFKLFPASVFKRRFLGIIKHLIF